MVQISIPLGAGQTRLVPIPDLPPPWRSIVVARRGGDVVAYWNVCRHLPIPLDGGTGHLGDGDTWVCATHGARFRILDGACIEGPCEGEALHPVRVVSADATEVTLDLRIPD